MVPGYSSMVRLEYFTKEKQRPVPWADKVNFRLAVMQRVVAMEQQPFLLEADLTSSPQCAVTADLSATVAVLLAASVRSSDSNRVQPMAPMQQ